MAINWTVITRTINNMKGNFLLKFFSKKYCNVPKMKPGKMENAGRRMMNQRIGMLIPLCPTTPTCRIRYKNIAAKNHPHI